VKINNLDTCCEQVEEGRTATTNMEVPVMKCTDYVGENEVLAGDWATNDYIVVYIAVRNVKEISY
jgi:hypothetical protein